MNKKSNTVFEIIKPFLVYWAACITYLIFGNWSVSGANISACLIYLIGGISCGYFMNFKKGAPGIILLSIQLIICVFIPWTTDLTRNISQLGNIFTTLFDFWLWNEKYSIPAKTLSIIIPIAVILIGKWLKSINKKQAE